MRARLLGLALLLAAPALAEEVEEDAVGVVFFEWSTPEGRGAELAFTHLAVAHANVLVFMDCHEATLSVLMLGPPGVRPAHLVAQCSDRSGAAMLGQPFPAGEYALLVRYEGARAGFFLEGQPTAS